MPRSKQRRGDNALDTLLSRFLLLSRRFCGGCGGQVREFVSGEERGDRGRSSSTVDGESPEEFACSGCVAAALWSYRLGCGSEIGAMQNGDLDHAPTMPEYMETFQAYVSYCWQGPVRWRILKAHRAMEQQTAVRMERLSHRACDPDETGR